MTVHMAGVDGQQLPDVVASSFQRLFQPNFYDFEYMYVRVGHTHFFLANDKADLPALFPTLLVFVVRGFCQNFEPSGSNFANATANSLSTLILEFCWHSFAKGLHVRAWLLNVSKPVFHCIPCVSFGSHLCAALMGHPVKHRTYHFVGFIRDFCAHYFDICLYHWLSSNLSSLAGQALSRCTIGTSVLVHEI